MRASSSRRRTEAFTSDDNLFNYQAKIIRDLAAKESCVIIGRCADYVLRDYPECDERVYPCGQEVLSGPRYGAPQHD